MNGDMTGALNDRIAEIYDDSLAAEVEYGDDISGAGLLGGASAQLKNNEFGGLKGGQGAGISADKGIGLHGETAISAAPPKPKGQGLLGSTGAAFENPTPAYGGKTDISVHKQPGPGQKLWEATGFGTPGPIESALGSAAGPVGRIVDQLIHASMAGRNMELVVLNDQIDHAVNAIPMLHPQTKEMLTKFLKELAAFAPATAKVR